MCFHVSKQVAMAKRGLKPMFVCPSKGLTERCWKQEPTKLLSIVFSMPGDSPWKSNDDGINDDANDDLDVDDADNERR